MISIRNLAGTGVILAAIFVAAPAAAADSVIYHIDQASEQAIKALRNMSRP